GAARHTFWSATTAGGTGRRSLTNHARSSFARPGPYFLGPMDGGSVWKGSLGPGRGQTGPRGYGTPPTAARPGPRRGAPRDSPVWLCRPGPVRGPASRPPGDDLGRRPGPGHDRGNLGWRCHVGTVYDVRHPSG